MHLTSEIESMDPQFPFAGGKANSLVFSFTAELCPEHALDGPEADYLKWIGKALFADVGTAADEAEWDKSTPEEREAWRLFHTAIEATSNLLELYQNKPRLFRKMGRQLSFLPCLMSWHPDAERFNRQYLESSQLGRQSMYGELRNNPRHLAQQSWPVRYAYSIIAAVDLTLDTYEDQLPNWAEHYGYGVKHPIPPSTYEAAAEKMGWDEEKKRRELPKYQGAYRILPAWTKGLSQLRRPFSKDHVLGYWRTGKEMILEEMPDFHLRPEWRTYHGRNYKSGAKCGAIQHAIFKDILAALKTIAGAGKAKAARASKSS